MKRKPLPVRFPTQAMASSRPMSEMEIRERVSAALCPTTLTYEGGAKVHPHDHQECLHQAARVFSLLNRLDYVVVPREVQLQAIQTHQDRLDEQYVQESIQQAAQHRQEGDDSVDAG